MSPSGCREPEDQLFRVAGVDLQRAVRAWLAELDQDDAVSRALLARAGREYEYGALLLMADIALAALRPAASQKTLLIYGVMAVFQHDGFGGRTAWTSAEAHVRHAFCHAANRGRALLARTLLQSVVDRASTRPAVWHQVVLERLLRTTAAAHAAHDQQTAQLRSRDLRAAALLDPTVTLDDLLLEGGGQL